MWDCRYHREDDYCRKRKAICFPGGVGCVLKNKFVFPFRKEEDPLIKSKQLKKRSSREWRRKKK